ncbi:helix-turn-helix domain-containing protein [Modestobacter sp. SSW1-42]|uniref:helix-turn-helix domain-containing protein n=1 Tax=Modestobacter sp. SSW1-42 TaxID=596372 RepID=UPI003985F8B6
MGDDELRGRSQLSAWVRRIRRAADLSQRELADALSVSSGAVARAETGDRDLPATVLMRAARLAGLRLALLDDAGDEVGGMAGNAVRDMAGRRFPAHLDTRYGDEGWWHDEVRYSRPRPWYTFDRDRRARDHRRTRRGEPSDHQVPQPGDAPQARARARRQAAWAEQRRLAEEGARRPTDTWAPTCTCPAGCDALLFPSAPLSARENAVPHVADCGCRCDVA